ncbi:uncharacterized protein LOC143451625 [Clavelina lepadiformis]|uniref:uncharacterized protein LOC143451625 n=1 Tax=Clavelina lepadiformis TaxID=159417 RepID=UPI004041EBF9
MKVWWYTATYISLQAISSRPRLYFSPVSIKLDNNLFPDVAEKKRIWIETLKSQLVHFEKLHWNEWSVGNNPRRYISLLCELHESSDMELFNMASLRFPTEMDLYRLKLSSSEAAIFCDVLSKQQKELEELGLSNCFSPDDVERLISAISEMPGKV